MERRHYSVPYALVNQQVGVHLTGETLGVLHGGVRVTSHVRSYVTGKATTLTEHMPKALQKYVSRKPSFISCLKVTVEYWSLACSLQGMIRKLKSGEFRLYSRKKDAKSGRRKNLGTFSTRDAAEKHERAVQFFKHGG